MEIKVLGRDARNGEVEKRVKNVLAELGIAADVEKITDIKKMMSYGILTTPGLVIDGKVVSSGRIPRSRRSRPGSEEARRRLSLIETRSVVHEAKNMASLVLTLVLALTLTWPGARTNPVRTGALRPPPPAAPARGVRQSEPPICAVKGEVLVTNRLDVDFSKYQVTFLELGADRCIPCKKMQPIMKEIAAAFPDRVQVIFYDVWKDPAPGREVRHPAHPDPGLRRSEGQGDRPPRRALSQGGDPRAPEEARHPVS